MPKKSLDHKQILDELIEGLHSDIESPTDNEGNYDLKLKCQAVDTLARLIKLRREIDKDEAKANEPKQLSWMEQLPPIPGRN